MTGSISLEPGDVASEPSEVLFLSEYSRVSRVTLPEGTTIICKEFLGPKALERWRHEVRLLERLKTVPGVPHLVPGEFPPCTLATDDLRAVPLTDLLREGRLEIRKVLELGLQLAQTLGAIHRAGVAHKNLTLDNILCHGPDQRALLIDFSLATTFAEERPGFVHPRDISGTLAYLAPEQTGRTGRPVDYRADLYALGVTLYCVATGRLPFAAADSLNLIHDILAKAPVPPSHVERSVPPTLSRIIMRLLEKEPERRYQGADGLAHDLRRLRKALSVRDPGAFPLGSRDFPLRLSPPSRLVGRDQEIALLKDAFERAISWGGCLLITGVPGVGKTALINELRPLVAARHGWFLSGKFDQYRRDLASDAVHQSLRALGRLLLAEPEAELAPVREKLLQTQGRNAGITAGIVPEMALLLGAAPEQLSGDPLQNKDRLAQAAFHVFRAVASPERPLTLVLDDLQWAAPTPLAFVDLVVQEGIPGLFLVGAFREDELDAALPLSPMLTRWAQASSPPPHLRLANLSSGQLTLLLAQMLRLHGNKAADLARVVGERTGGNPYDTVELVNALRHEGILRFAESGWSWEAPAIRRYVGGGDVVDLLSSRIERLPGETRAMVETAACLGGEVQLALLEAASALSAAALEEVLAPALEDGLLVLDLEVKGSVSFRHDRVQQAAYRRLEPAARIALHIALGRRLAQHPEFAHLAAEQYLPALEVLRDPAECRMVIGLLHLAAGQVESVNFTMAERFLSAALTLLKVYGTRADAPLFTNMEAELHAALYSLARFEEADHVYRRIQMHCEDPVQISTSACLQICSLTNRGRPAEAVTLGLDLLFRLGVVVPPERELEEAISKGLALLENFALHGKVAEEVARPETTDRRILATARLINRMIPPAYFSGQTVTPWLFLVALRLWVDHGPCAALVGPLSHASFITIAGQGDYRTGYRAVRHVLDVSEARGYEPDTSQARFLFTLSAGIWFEPLEENVALARRSHEGLLHGGDLQNACFAYFSSIPSFFECADTLESFYEAVEECLAFTARTGNDHCTRAFSHWRELALCLGDDGGPLAPLADGVREAGEMGGTLAANFHLTRALAAFFTGDVEGLVRHAREGFLLLPYMEACYATALLHLLQALALAHRMQNLPSDECAPLLREFGASRDWLAARAADAPGNFRHLLLLAEAEGAAAQGDFRGALRAFEAAMSQVDQLRRPGHRALITERAALFHLANGLERSGAHLLADACRQYEAWGAAGKVRRLEESYPFLRAPRNPQHAEHPVSVSLDAVDMLAVLRASQALSSETSLERLRAQVVQLLGSMTGASAVSLLIWQEEGGWYLLPEAAGDEETRPLPLAEAGLRQLIPMSVLRYLERTREPLLVQDAVKDDRFSFDPYFERLECCSLLALPIFNHGELSGVLLLENHLSRGAFTDQGLDAVKLMAGQLAVSLENALLYRQLEERVRQRTAELSEAQSELMSAARQAGMAEIATNVLHNVGNVLNSVNISAGMVVHALGTSKARGLAMTVQLLKEHAADLGTFLTEDPRGKLLPGYLEKLSRALEEEQQGMTAELSRLVASVDHIKEIVATQQSYAGASSMREPVRIPELLDDALRMNVGALERHKVAVVKECAEMAPIPLDKARVLQILVNLISNAKYAMDGAGYGSQLTLRAAVRDGRLRIEVCDEGEGIAPENLSRIFSHGFTTRRSGHGFGLHSSSLAAKEMGGTLTVHSEGVGKGAVFILDLPASVQ